MQDTESVKTLSTELKQLSRSSGRRGETDADAGGRLFTQQMTEKIMEHL